MKINSVVDLDLESVEALIAKMDFYMKYAHLIYDIKVIEKESKTQIQ